MQRIKYLIFGILGCILLCAPIAYAENQACELVGVFDPLICGYSGKNEEAELQATIKRVLETVYIWVGIVAVIVIIIAGVMYMMSMGSSEKTQKAKNAIMYALIGLVVTLMAFAITEFAIGAIGG